MVCNALVAGGQRSGAVQQAMRPGWGKLCDSHNFSHPGRIARFCAPNRRPPATKSLHTICGNNTSIVSSSWWWAYKCPKHVEQIISAIKAFRSIYLVFFSTLLQRCTHKHISNISNFPKRCNTKPSIYYSAISFYMFRVSTTPIIRSTQNCNYSLRYWPR